MAPVGSDWPRITTCWIAFAIDRDVHRLAHAHIGEGVRALHVVVPEVLGAHVQPEEDVAVLRRGRQTHAIGLLDPREGPAPARPG